MALPSGPSRWRGPRWSDSSSAGRGHSTVAWSPPCPCFAVGPCSAPPDPSGRGAPDRCLPPPHPRHEDQATGLVLDQPLDQATLLTGQLAVAHPHVAQEHHVKLGELVQPGWKHLDVVLVASAHLAQPG